MQKILIFILGVITGVLLLLFFSYIISESEKKSNVSNIFKNEIVMFTEPGDCLNQKQSFQVSRVVESGAALARELSNTYGDSKSYYGLEVLFLSEGKEFYDGEIITVPKNKCVRHVGVYKYMMDTFPVVEISDK